MEAAPGSLQSTRLRLREVRPEDYGFLYGLAVTPETGYHWRFRDSQPSYEQFVTRLSQSVFHQYLVVRRSDDRVLGLVVCYQANLRNRNGYVGVQGIPEAYGTGALIEAAQLFIEFLFARYDFHKLYAECPSFNTDRFMTGLGSSFLEEGRLKDHERYLGKWWDLVIFALYRQDWEQSRSAGSEQHRGRLPTLSRRADGSAVSESEFLSFVAASLDLDPESLLLTAHLERELGFDSIAMYELVCVLEDAGLRLADERLQEFHTLEDFYFAYLQTPSTGPVVR